jgi:hypothetical protein
MSLGGTWKVEFSGSKEADTTLALEPKIALNADGVQLKALAVLSDVARYNK